VHSKAGKQKSSSTAHFEISNPNNHRMNSSGKLYNVIGLHPIRIYVYMYRECIHLKVSQRWHIIHTDIQGSD